MNNLFRILQAWGGVSIKRSTSGTKSVILGLNLGDHLQFGFATLDSSFIPCSSHLFRIVHFITAHTPPPPTLASNTGHTLKAPGLAGPTSPPPTAPLQRALVRNASVSTRSEHVCGQRQGPQQRSAAWRTAQPPAQRSTGGDKPTKRRRRGKASTANRGTEDGDMVVSHLQDNKKRHLRDRREGRGQMGPGDLGKHR